jgi:hypothetical protein
MWSFKLAGVISLSLIGNLTLILSLWSSNTMIIRSSVISKELYMVIMYIHRPLKSQLKSNAYHPLMPVQAPAVCGVHSYSMMTLMNLLS